ncbi:MAG: hypothetical protein ACOC7S_00805 [Planctomycetota bacterium]
MLPRLGHIETGTDGQQELLAATDVGYNEIVLQNAGQEDALVIFGTNEAHAVPVFADTQVRMRFKEPLRTKVMASNLTDGNNFADLYATGW